MSKVVYDPKGTDPFTFRWYDPDEVIAGKKMREHLKFALSYWHTIDAEGVDMFGSGTMDKSMGQTDPMAKFRAKADFAFELMESWTSTTTASMTWTSPRRALPWPRASPTSA